MKKILILLSILMLLFSGCSDSKPKQTDTNNVTSASTVAKQEQSTTTQESTTQQKSVLQSTTEKKQSTIDKSWFTGLIGNSKVHAKLDISGNKISGVYYYDQYKTNIKIEGSINGFVEMKDFQTISLTEDTGKQVEIKGVFRTNDYIEGCWKKDNVVYPLYLIREGSEITPPKQPGTAIMRFDGHWTGKNSGYFAGSEADIKVLFNDLFYYELYAFNGTHTGTLESFGIIKNGVSKTVFNDATYDEKKDNIIFEFKIENNLLELNSNGYDYYCGMGVGFDSGYTKEKVDISLPTALQVGIVETKEQDETFKKLVGPEYESFIQYTQGVSYTEDILDGEKVRAGTSLLRGMHGYCFYIISQKYMYVAIVKDDCIEYYTNDKKYSQKLPQPMIEWTTYRKDMEINYNYKE